MTILAIVLMVGALFLTPLGIPGNWIMLAVLAVAAFYGHVGAAIFISCLLLAAVGEVVEFMVLKRLSAKYGGSRRAFWGAIAGGVAGVLIGLPVPIVGSIFAGLIGSFAGAAAVTMAETRSTHAAGRVGWGVLLGRTWAAAAKTAAGLAILVLGAAAMLL